MGLFYQKSLCLQCQYICRELFEEIRWTNKLNRIYQQQIKIVGAIPVGRLVAMADQRPCKDAPPSKAGRPDLIAPTESNKQKKK